MNETEPPVFDIVWYPGREGERFETARHVGVEYFCSPQHDIGLFKSCGVTVFDFFQTRGLTLDEIEAMKLVVEQHIETAP